MIVDANVLLYAVDDRSQFHDLACSWLDEAMNGMERVGLPWVSLMAFQRVITHPRATPTPLTPSAAWSFIHDWIEAEQAWIPTPGIRHQEILSKLLIEGDLRGNLVTDAHLAALAMENGTGICSFDSDFARFQDLNWIKPSI